jgi:hypothetical protein
VSVAPELVPLDQVPRDTREVATPVFALLAPAAFTESERPGPGGIPMVVLSGDTGPRVPVVEVVAFSDPEPDAPVQEQMAGLVVSLVDVDGRGTSAGSWSTGRARRSRWSSAGPRTPPWPAGAR